MASTRPKHTKPIILKGKPTKALFGGMKDTCIAGHANVALVPAVFHN